MRVLVDFRKPFVALEEALLLEGCEIVRYSEFEKSEIQNIDACLVDFCDSARCIRRLWRLKRGAERVGAVVVGIDRDAPWHKGVKAWKLWLVSKLRLLDIYAAHSIQESARFAQPLYFPNAAWIEKYHLHGRSLESLRDPAGYLYEVAFIGNINDQRYPEHRHRVEFLRQLQLLLSEDGIKLELFDGTAMSVEQQVTIIQTTRINLNYGAAADNGGEASWGLPERCYGIPACGGFLISDRRCHAALDFDLNTEWIDFADMDECIFKIKYYLSNFDQARAIAERAHSRVVKQHTYSDRARSLIAAIGKFDMSK